MTDAYIFFPQADQKKGNGREDEKMLSGNDQVWKREGRKSKNISEINREQLQYIELLVEGVVVGEIERGFDQLDHTGGEKDRIGG